MEYCSIMISLAFVIVLALSVSAEEVCFDDLDCFSNEPPYDSLPAFPPFSPSRVNTRFILYTRLNTDLWMEVSRKDPESLTNSLFQPQLKTFFYIHGYSNPGFRGELSQAMKDGLLKMENCNVFIVDWTGGSNGLYGQSVQNSRVAGREIGYFLQFLHEQTSLQYSQVHLIGYSLGAHTAGYAGETTPGVRRISGLDPAGPYFRNLDTATRLDRTDADFVDVIHTDGEVLLKIGVGMLHPLGHVDFYPNGGKEQPGCPKNVTEFIEGRFSGVGCSHSRGPELFLDSLDPSRTCESIGYPCTSWENFQAGRCTDCGTLGCPVMGFFADESRAKGIYFLETGATSPYCLIDD